MRSEQIFTRAFYSSFRPYKFYLIVYDTHGNETVKTGEVSKKDSITQEKKKNLSKAQKTGKFKVSKGGVPPQVKKKTMETHKRRNQKKGTTVRLLRTKRVTGRTLHKKVHLQSRMAVRTKKHSHPMRKVQRVPARKPGRVPEVDGRKVRSKRSRGNGKSVQSAPAHRLQPKRVH